MNRQKLTGGKREEHPFPPFFCTNAEILILGSFPSVASREQGFYYGHPQNRFWRVLAAVYDDRVPISIEEKKKFLQKNKIALWDVIAACTIEGSADSSIRGAEVNDLNVILKNAPIKSIYTNGKTAFRLYERHCSILHGAAILLPSTSPANAQYKVERLVDLWRRIREKG